MVASPDHLLDPRYYPEQHEEWVREEYEMPGYRTRSLEDVSWYCGKCGERMAIRGLDGLWELGVGVVPIREAGKPIGARCSCGSRGDWQEEGWGELRLRSLLNVGGECDISVNAPILSDALQVTCLTRWCDERRGIEGRGKKATKDWLEEKFITELIREGWFVRRARDNAIEVLCPDCSAQVIDDQTSWPDD